MIQEAIKNMLNKLDTMLEFDESIDVNSVEELKSKYDTFVKENFSMTQENKDLLLRDLCGRLPYEAKIHYKTAGWEDKNHTLSPQVIDNFLIRRDIVIKPYLRPMSSMTEKEARDIAILHGYNPEEILSLKITNEYIDIILDNCDHSTITSTIWYDGIISSLECFDYLNKKMFDFRGLIPKDLAIEVTEENNPYKD